MTAIAKFASTRSLLLAMLLGGCHGPHWSAAVPVSSAARNVDELSVLTYNVHGLPGLIAGDNPKGRLPLIGARVRNYDVALIQEIWTNERLLLDALGDSIVVPGKGPRGRGLDRFLHPYGSGLLVVSRLSPSLLLETNSGEFGTCEGRWRRANDCWARKGYVRVRMKVAGATIDFYTLHLDAGESAADRAVRAKQLDYLRARVQQESAQTAVIIAGDFNSAFENGLERTQLEAFCRALDLRESGARADVGRWRENIDYVLYRSGPRASLNLIEARVDTTFTDRGRALSDHPAIAVRFAIQG